MASASDILNGYKAIQAGSGVSAPDAAANSAEFTQPTTSSAADILSQFNAKKTGSVSAPVSLQTAQDTVHNKLGVVGDYLINSPINFVKETLGFLGGMTRLVYGAGFETGKRLSHPIEAGIPGIQSDIGQYGNLLGTIGAGVTDPRGPLNTFIHPIKSTQDAYDAAVKLHNLPEGQARQAFSNFEQLFMKQENIAPLTKIIGGAGMSMAETFGKLATDFKSTTVNEPLMTTLNLLQFGDMTGINAIAKASAAELGKAGVAKIQEGRFGKVIDGMIDYQKAHALDKELTADHLAAMDEFDRQVDQMNKAMLEHFQKHLTREERQRYPYYAKGLLKLPADASDDLRIALIKGEALKRTSSQSLIDMGALTKSIVEDRIYGSVRAKIAYSNYGKLLDQLTPTELADVEQKFNTVKPSLDAFYYPAISKKSSLGFARPAKVVSKAKPGMLKQFTGASELTPEKFYQDPFVVMSKSEASIKKYLFDRAQLAKTIQKYGERIQLGDEVKPGYTVIAPDGHTKLLDPIKAPGDLIEQILTDPNIDLPKTLFGNSVEEVANNLGVDLYSIASDSRKIDMYQVPNAVAKNIQRRIAGSAFRQEMAKAENFGEALDAIRTYPGQAVQSARRSMISLFKKVVLGFYPGRWIKGNVVANIIMSMMEGLTPKDFLESSKMVRFKGVYKDLEKITDPNFKFPELKSNKPLIQENVNLLRQIHQTIGDNLEQLKVAYKDNSGVLKQIEQVQENIKSLSETRAEEFFKFFNSDIPLAKEVPAYRSIKQLPERFQVIGEQAKAFKTLEDLNASPVGLELERLDLNGDLQRAGFSSVESFFDAIKNPVKYTDKHVVEVSSKGALSKLIKAQSDIDRLTETVASLKDINLRSVQDNLRYYSNVLGDLENKKFDIQSTIEDLKATEPDQLELAQSVYERYNAKIAKALGIKQDRLDQFLPRGVTSGDTLAEVRDMVKKSYNVDEQSSTVQKAWQVWKDGFNWLPNKSFKWNSQIESWYRRASFYHEVSKLAKGVLKKTGREVNAQNILDEVISNPEMQQSALEQVNKFFGDYLTQSKVTDYIPFIRFYKHIAKLALTYPLEFPGRAILLNRVIHAQDAVDEEIKKTQSLPSYLQSENNLPLNIGGKQYRLAIKSTDPFGNLDLTDVKPIHLTGFDPIDTLVTAVLQQATPDIKVGLERIKEYDLFKQKPFSTEFQQKYYNAKAVPDLNEHILKNIPGFTDARKLVDALIYWKKTGKFEVPARDSVGDVMKDKSGNPVYTNSELLELLKPLGISLTPEDDYQSMVDKALGDLRDQQIEENRKAGL